MVRHKRRSLDGDLPNRTKSFTRFVGSTLSKAWSHDDSWIQLGNHDTLIDFRGKKLGKERVGSLVVKLFEAVKARGLRHVWTCKPATAKDHARSDHFAEIGGVSTWVAVGFRSRTQYSQIANQYRSLFYFILLQIGIGLGLDPQTSCPKSMVNFSAN